MRTFVQERGGKELMGWGLSLRLRGEVEAGLVGVFLVGAIGAFEGDGDFLAHLIDTVHGCHNSLLLWKSGRGL